MRFCSYALTLFFCLTATAAAVDTNRLAYLDEVDPYYVHRKFSKLVTPQWVGEPGVEAVVILGIDDMREPPKYETFLRPILRRLQQIDGRAPVSIMTCSVKPDEPHLQKWLKEGLSLETHTIDHPCPLLARGDFAAARSTYERCVDLLSSVPNNKPVAFRTPCCDSLNTLSPRFLAGIFNKTTPTGNFLTIDTSVFNVFTSNDPELPRELVIDPDGQDKFRKYVPYDRSFVNTIEDYPYPYVVGQLCWEFPCMTPSDWQAQHRHKPNNPATVRDWKAALDCTVIKQGVFCLVFHPHGWIQSEQVVDLIDHAVAKHGKKVKFLTFREAQERLDKHLLGGVPLRDPQTGGHNGVWLADFNADGFLDVRVCNQTINELRIWKPRAAGGPWHRAELADADRLLPHFQGFTTTRKVKLGGTRAYVAAHDKEQAVFVWSSDEGKFARAPFSLPSGARLGSAVQDNGLRFVDIDEDGHDDVIFSNEEGYGLYLFTDFQKGWSRKVLAGKAGEPDALPMISRNGTNNGFWVHSRHLWWQNEHTALLPNLVDRRSFNDLLRNVEPGAEIAGGILAFDPSAARFSS